MKPISNRKNGIIEKLDYADVRINEVDEAIHSVYEGNIALPRYLGLKTEGILGDITECLDHLSKDIIENFLIPEASAKTKKAYATNSKNLNTYFPLYEKNLTQTQGKFVWHELKSIRTDVYDALKQLLDAMTNNGMFLNTSIRCDILKTTREMVNEKKHNRVFEIASHDHGRKFIRGGIGDDKFSVSYDTRDDQGQIKHVHVINATTTKDVLVYKFSNGYEIGDFCKRALYATRTVMDTFYVPFFEPSERNVRPPREDIKITSSKEPPPHGPMIDISGLFSPQPKPNLP